MTSTIEIRIRKALPGRALWQVPSQYVPENFGSGGGHVDETGECERFSIASNCVSPEKTCRWCFQGSNGGFLTEQGIVGVR